MDKEYRELGVTLWGDYNTAPEPMTKCDASDFWREFHSYGSSVEIDHRQIFSKGRSVQNLHIMIFFDAIFAIELQNDWTPQFYRIGCEHAYEDVTIGHCLHEYTCKKCGFKQTIDSSD